MSVIIVCEVRGKGKHRKGVIYSVRYADFTPCVPDLRQRVSFNHNIDVICKFKFSHQLIKWYISDVYQTVGPALDCFGVIYMLHDEMIVLHTYHLVRTQDIYLVAEKYNITPRKVKREIQHVLEIMRTSLKDYLPLLILLYVISGKLN